MKYIRLFFLATIAFLLSVACLKSYAQSPYKASVGGIVYGLALGPSFKAFFTNHVAFQTDMFLKGVLSAGKDVNTNRIGFAPYLSVETNVNLIYQKKIKEKTYTELFLLAGGGVSLGYSWTPGSGKFGINAIMGLEYVFKNIPLAIQIDLRPGYGLLFNSNYKYVDAIFFTHNNPWSHFDWCIPLTFRYSFKEK